MDQQNGGIASSTAFYTSSPLPYVWNIPYPRNPIFTGREELLICLATLLKASQTTTLTQPQAISGLGGIGKTQLAVEYAYCHRSDYQAVLWVQADIHGTLVSSFVTIARLLNLPEKDSLDQAITVNAVIRWMKTHTAWLLILDNSDDLEMVREFIPPIFGGHILLTTRAQAKGRLAQRIELEIMSPEIGALFLLRRAMIIAFDAPLEKATTADQKVAMEIAQELGGLPLALDQAGSHIEETACDLPDYLKLYSKQKSALLRRRGGLITDHPQPVTTTWSFSFDHIERKNSAASDLLRFCAFLYPDMIPEEIIIKGIRHLGSLLQPIARDTLAFNDTLEALRAYSFISRDVTNRALTIHRLVQAELRDEMSTETYQQWAERSLRAVNEVLPWVEFDTWPECERDLSNAQVCSTLIEQNIMIFPEAARLLNQTSQYLYERGQCTEAEPLLRQALMIREQCLGQEHPDTSTSMNNLGLLYYAQGKYAETEPLYTRALAIRDHPDTAMSMSNLAMLYHVRGNYTEAKSLLKRALAIREQRLGAEHPATATTITNLAWLCRTQEKYAEAEVYYILALAIREQRLGAEHPDTAKSMHGLGDLYYAEGKYKEAELLLRRALLIQEQKLEANHPDTAKSMNSLALLYLEQRKYEQAESLLQRALAIQEQQLGKEHLLIATSLNNLAKLYHTQERYEEAEPLLKQALKIYQCQAGIEHPDTLLLLKDYALFLQKMRRDTEAELFEVRATSLWGNKDEHLA